MRTGHLLPLIALLGVAGAAVVALGGREPLGPSDGLDLPAVDTGRIQVGDIAPDFTLAAYGGGHVTLSDHRGEENVVLVFYRGHW